MNQQQEAVAAAQAADVRFHRASKVAAGLLALALVAQVGVAALRPRRRFP
jgi:hypothetical protein